jgi:hypothetical protein
MAVQVQIPYLAQLRLLLAVAAALAVGVVMVLLAQMVDQAAVEEVG